MEPDADGVLGVSDRDELRISLIRKRMESSDEIQLVLVGGEERVHHLDRHLYLHLRFLGPVLLEDMNKEGPVVLGDADIGVFILDRNELAVPGTSNCVSKRPQINAMAVNIVESDLAAVQAVLIDCRENLFGELRGDVHAHVFFFGVRIADSNMQPAIMAGYRSGVRRAASRSVLGLGGRGK